MQMGRKMNEDENHAGKMSESENPAGKMWEYSTGSSTKPDSFYLRPRYILVNCNLQAFAPTEDSWWSTSMSLQL